MCNNNNNYNNNMEKDEFPLEQEDFSLPLKNVEVFTWS